MLREHQTSGIESLSASSDNSDIDPNELKKFNIQPPKQGFCCFKSAGKTEEDIKEQIRVLDSQIENCKKIFEQNEEDKNETNCQTNGNIHKSKREEAKNAKEDQRKVKEFCGKAFIILNNQNEATRINNEFHVRPMKRIFRYIWYKLICRKKNKQHGFGFKTDRAAEPTDVFWENLPISARVRFVRSIFTFMAMAVLLSISFVCNYVFGIFKDQLERQYDNNGNTFKLFNFFILMLLNILNAIVISFFNVSLKTLAKFLTEYEGHDTYTSFTLSLTIKMIVTMYINTAIIPLCVNYSEKYWFAGTGLIADIFYNTLAVCFIGPITYIFDPLTLLKSCRKSQEKKKNKNGKCKLTQSQFNELFEGQQMSLENRYTSAFLIILVCCTYTVLLPILPLICFLGIIYQYYLTKYMLVYHNTRPREIGYFMDISATNIFIFVILVNGGSIWYFLTRLSDGHNFFAWIPLLIAVFCVFLPVRYIEKILKVNEVLRSDEDTYDSYKNFPFTYKSCNPVEGDGSINIERLAQYAEQDKLQQHKIIFGDIGKDVREALDMGRNKVSMNVPRMKKHFSGPVSSCGVRRISKTQDLTRFRYDEDEKFDQAKKYSSTKHEIKSIINAKPKRRKQWMDSDKAITEKIDGEESKNGFDILSPRQIYLESKDEINVGANSVLPGLHRDSLPSCPGRTFKKKKKDIKELQTSVFQSSESVGSDFKSSSFQSSKQGSSYLTSQQESSQFESKDENISSDENEESESEEDFTPSSYY